MLGARRKASRKSQRALAITDARDDDEYRASSIEHRARRMKIDEVPSLAKKSRIATHTHIKVCLD